MSRARSTSSSTASSRNARRRRRLARRVEASRVSRANSSESVGGGGGGGGSGGVAAAFPEPLDSAPSRLEADYDQQLQLAVASTDASCEEIINFDLLLNGSSVPRRAPRVRR